MSNLVGSRVYIPESYMCGTIKSININNQSVDVHVIDYMGRSYTFSINEIEIVKSHKSKLIGPRVHISKHNIFGKIISIDKKPDIKTNKYIVEILNDNGKRYHFSFSKEEIENGIKPT